MTEPAPPLAQCSVCGSRVFVALEPMEDKGDMTTQRVQCVQCGRTGTRLTGNYRLRFPREYHDIESGE